MAKNKLKKFADILSFSNVYENYDPKYPKLVKNRDQEVSLKGRWSEIHFNNNNPLTLELACGRGEYTVALAKAFPEKNFIGVDVKGARIWKGAKEALDQSLYNAAFLRTRIEQLPLFIGENEVNEIWITFPDPFLRESKENKRLTSAAFLSRYKPLLKKDAIMHLKTDDDTLYHFTLETLNDFSGAQILFHHHDIYQSDLLYPELQHKTYYEHMHLKAGKTIKYIRFSINNES